jgi:hypothetical protein
MSGWGITNELWTNSFLTHFPFALPSHVCNKNWFLTQAFETASSSLKLPFGVLPASCASLNAGKAITTEIAKITTQNRPGMESFIVVVRSKWVCQIGSEHNFSRVTTKFHTNNFAT